MSYKDFLNITTSFNKTEYHVNEHISGEIIIFNNSPIHLDIEDVQISLCLKHQGKGETGMIILETINCKDYKLISKGQSISLNFNFSPAYNVTFNGRNMTQNIVVKTTVDITKESEKSLRTQKLSNFKIGGYLGGLLSPDFHNTTPVFISKGTIPYLFTNASGVIKPGIQKAKLILGIGSIALLILSIIVAFNANRSEIWWSLISIFGILFAAVYYFKILPYRAIGPIEFTLQNSDNNHYTIHLKFKKRGLSNPDISCQLTGIEKVTYDNGSSRSTAKHTFFESASTIIKTKSRSISEDVELPTESLPISIDNNDFEILWYFKITVRTRNNKVISGKHIVDLKYRKTLK